MRKVLSFVLVLSLVLGSFGMAFAAAPTDVEGSDYETAVEVLMALGIVNGYEDGTYKPDKTVTRAEMAKLLIVALGLDNLVGGSKSSFSDMSGHWADSYVALAAAKNIINGYPDGTFNPNATVSFNEAITMIVRTLGYNDEYVTELGGWPIGYLEIAQDEDITDDADATSTRGNVAQLIYNALSADTVRITGSASEGFDVDEKSALYEKVGAELDEDVAISPDLNYDDDESLVDLTEYMYADVDVYRNDDDVIVAVDDIESDKKVGEIDVDAEEIELANEDTVDISAIDSETPVYLNGGAAKYGDVKDIIDGFEVTVYGNYDKKDERFEDSKTDADDAIDGLVVWAPTNVKLADSDVEDEVKDVLNNDSSDLFDFSIPQNDDDENKMDRISMMGDVKEFTDIEENDVVYVYASGDDKRAKFEVVRDSVKGDVTDFDSSNNKVYVDGTKYSKSGLEEVGSVTFPEDEDVLGSTVELFLDKEGKVFDYDTIEESEGKYAVVIKTHSATDDIGDDVAYLKLYTYNGEEVVYEVKNMDDDYEVADGKWVDTTKAVPAVKELVEFSLNSSGKINSLKKVATQDAAGKYNDRTDLLAGKDVEDALIFDANDEDDISIISELADDAEVTTGYGKVSSGDWKVIVIADGDELVESTDEYFAVNRATTALDDEDDKVTKVVGFSNGEKATKLTDTDNKGKMDEAGFYKVTYEDGVITTVADPTDLVTDAVNRTVTAIKTYALTLSDDSSHELGDDLTVYIKDYDEDGFVEYKLGSKSSISKGDLVYIYDTDDDEDGAETIIVVKKGDIDDM